MDLEFPLNNPLNPDTNRNLTEFFGRTNLFDIADELSASIVAEPFIVDKTTAFGGRSAKKMLFYSTYFHLPNNFHHYNSSEVIKSSKMSPSNSISVAVLKK